MPMEMPTAAMSLPLNIPNRPSYLHADEAQSAALHWWLQTTQSRFELMSAAPVG